MARDAQGQVYTSALGAIASAPSAPKQLEPFRDGMVLVPRPADVSRCSLCVLFFSFFWLAPEATACAAGLIRKDTASEAGRVSGQQGVARP